MAETPPAARLAALRSAVENCAPHEIKKAGQLLREGADLLSSERSDALTEGWCRWLIRDAGPNWRRALDEADASDAIDAVIDGCGLCVASEALIGATSAAAVIVAQRVRSWDVSKLVAALADACDVRVAFGRPFAPPGDAGGREARREGGLREERRREGAPAVGREGQSVRVLLLHVQKDGQRVARKVAAVRVDDAALLLLPPEETPPPRSGEKARKALPGAG